MNIEIKIVLWVLMIIIAVVLFFKGEFEVCVILLTATAYFILYEAFPEWWYAMTRR